MNFTQQNNNNNNNNNDDGISNCMIRHSAFHEIRNSIWNDITTGHIVLLRKFLNTSKDLNEDKQILQELETALTYSTSMTEESSSAGGMILRSSSNIVGRHQFTNVMSMIREGRIVQSDNVRRDNVNITEEYFMAMSKLGDLEMLLDSEKTVIHQRQHQDIINESIDTTMPLTDTIHETILINQLFLAMLKFPQSTYH